MSKPYFSQIPYFLYVDRSPGNKTIDDYSEVKNLFKRAKLREDIFSDLSYFTKYQIQGDERPDNVAEKYYEDSTLDWVILLANNITNIQTEWPMSEQSYYNFLIDKYGTDEKLQEVHHYECAGVTNSSGAILSSNVSATNISEAVTNLTYEDNIQDKKRNIFILKPEYLSVLFNDLEEIMEYKKGSTQYVDGTLKVGENIRLYPN